jgi:hypothetical protein
MALKIANLSHSSISQFASCPRSWAARHIEGFIESKGDAARFGDAFDKLIGEQLGFPITEYTNDDGKKEKCEAGFYRSRYCTTEVNNALQHYFAQQFAWKEAKATQVFVQILPEKWAELAEHYGANPFIPSRLIGFIDLLRATPESEGLDEGIRPVEIVDLKTVGQDVWKEEWARQCTLYALATGAVRWSIHRFVRGRPDKLAERVISMDSPEAKRLTREVMDHTAYYAKQIVTVRDEPGLIDHLPRHAGWQCKYCPLYGAECVSGRVFEGGVLPGKFKWAKGGEEIATCNTGFEGVDLARVLEGIK